LKVSNSLSFRLLCTLWGISALSCLLSVILGGLIPVLEERLALDETLRQTTDQLVNFVFLDLTAEREIERTRSEVKDVLSFKRSNLIIRVFDANHRVLYSSLASPDDLFLKSVSEKDYFDQIIGIKGLGHDYRVIQKPFKLLSGEARRVQVAMELPEFGAALKKSGFHYLVVFSVLCFISLFISRLFSEMILSPVKLIAQHLSQFENLELKQWSPIPQAGDSQFLGEIITATNNLIARIQQSYLANQNMARYIAHEIRTPLTMMLGELETSQDEIVSAEVGAMHQRFIKDVNQIEVIVDTILELAERGRKGSAYEPKSTKIADVLAKCIQNFKRIFEHPIDLTIQPNSPSEVLVDPDLFAILMDNLFRNSLKHGAKNFWLGVSVMGDARDGYLKVLVEDSGPGLREEVLDAANSSKPAKATLGIGLSLCREVCKVAGWKMEFQNRDSGGLTISIFLPVTKSISFDAVAKSEFAQDLDTFWN